MIAYSCMLPIIMWKPRKVPHSYNLQQAKLAAIVKFLFKLLNVSQNILNLKLSPNKKKS